MNFGKSLLFFSLLIFACLVSVAFSEEAQPLKLTITTDKAEYLRTEPVHLTYTLENVSSGPVTICAEAAGTIHVESYKVDGEPITRVPQDATDLETVISDWYNGLRTLAPGEKVEFEDALETDYITNKGPAATDIVVEPVEENGKRILKTNSYAYNPPKGEGTYTLELYYLFTGPPKDSSSPTPYKGKVLSNQVSFVVR